MKRKAVVKTMRLMVRGGGFEFPFFYFWRITIMLFISPLQKIWTEWGEKISMVAFPFV